MKPRQLIISGLTSFETRTVVDFSDAPLFALVGPTGSGKSSVIDAITLALYGRIPRLRANEVAPVISTGATECTVGLEFTVRGEAYKAVRTIRRTKTGASTLEAVMERLDADGAVIEVLAGTADDVTDKTEALLGLSFDEFTRAVVLPQGQFARVLTATPSERQKLLAKLLGTEVYEEVKRRAGEHARAAESRAEQTALQIAQLGRVEQDDIDRAEATVKKLKTVVDQLTVLEKETETVRDEYRTAVATVEEVKRKRAALDSVPPPPEPLRHLAARIDAAKSAATSAENVVREREAELAAATVAAGTVDDTETLQRIITDHERTPVLQNALDQAKTAVSEVEKQIVEVEQQLVDANDAVDVAVHELETVRRTAAAAAAAAGLHVGDACPVCAGTLDDDAPGLSNDAETARTTVGETERAYHERLRRQQALRTRSEALVADRKRAAERLDETTGTLENHLANVQNTPDLADATANLERFRAAQRVLGERQQDVVDARRVHNTAVADVEAATAATVQYRQDVDELRLTVASWDPPPVTGQVLDDWDALHRWAETMLPDIESVLSDAERNAEAIKQRGSALRQNAEKQARNAGIADSPERPRDRAVTARAEAQADVAQLKKTAKIVAQLLEDENDARERHTVATVLASQLRSDKFQRWLLDETTTALIAGASDQLFDLSDGRYELQGDHKGNISVVDLAAAGLARSVRTLSGGETFLASLALALSLADQIAASATGRVAVESLFIDEGFGALDAETLDIAAAAIEHVGSGDRTVGVITHVAEMAQRLPLRFVVSKNARGSTVTREEA